jgi:FtsZ-binding cell division protein ZapB
VVSENYGVVMSVEELQQKIDRLTAERQNLRSTGAERARLEENRVELVQAQWSLAHALIARHFPHAA